MHPKVKLRTNREGQPWVVQKYGGTSVGKLLDDIASTIVPSFMDTHRVAVVCSARSGESKKTGTTNRLLRAAEEALKEGSSEYLEIVKDITQDHLEAAREHVKDPTILQDLENQLQNDCFKLRSFLQAAEIIDEISPRSRDIIASIGEKLSCTIVTAALRDRGIDAELVMLNNIIDQEFTVLNQEFYDYVASRIALLIHECGSKVPVLTGFFGNVPGSLLATMGRGYTDLCAALVAVGLQAQELQIWKEVDGIFTADPRKVKGARLLLSVSPEEAAELTYYGSEVIHPFTMEQIIRVGIPIRIKNVKNPAGPGTIIFPTPKSQSYSVPRHPTAVTVKDNVCVLNIHSNRKNVSHGFLAKIFTILDDHGIVVDLISTSEVHVSMALGADMVESNLEHARKELETLGTVDVVHDMAILSLVGKHMKNSIGLAGKMFSTLAKANINIEIISQEASEINISCVVEEKKALEALKAIHEELLRLDPGVQGVQ
ncbi:Aspartokinase [Apophysomyces ossiformis]|uniref:Aspartokinase n=1 Tax=Apophysomyces ossiformis TaxID=679940 RepID=A0A8H7ER63_9FUNG|nr:Aspartokinase [Apophysomyces ossiformis]